MWIAATQAWLAYCRLCPHCLEMTSCKCRAQLTSERITPSFAVLWRVHSTGVAECYRERAWSVGASADYRLLSLGLSCQVAVEFSRPHPCHCRTTPPSYLWGWTCWSGCRMTESRSIGHLRKTLGFASRLGALSLQDCCIRAYMHSWLVCSLPSASRVLNRRCFRPVTE